MGILRIFKKATNVKYVVEGRYGTRGRWVRLLTLDAEKDPETVRLMLEQPEVYSRLRLKREVNGLPMEIVWQEENPEFDPSLVPTPETSSRGKGSQAAMITQEEWEEYKEFVKGRMDAGLEIMRKGYEAAVDIMKSALTESTKLSAETVKAKVEESKKLVEMIGGQGGTESGSKEGGVIRDIVAGITEGVAKVKAEQKERELAEKGFEVPER